MGNCCRCHHVELEGEIQKGRQFEVDNKIFTLRKYGNTDINVAPSHPYLGGKEFKSFKEEKKSDKNSNVKSDNKKTKRSSSKKSTKSDPEFVRSSSMVEFCNEVANK